MDLGPAPTLGEALADAQAPVGRRQGPEPAGRLGPEGSPRTSGSFTPLISPRSASRSFARPPPPCCLRSGGRPSWCSTLPIYDGGTSHWRARERHAMLAEADANLEAILRQSGADVRLSIRGDAAGRSGFGGGPRGARLAHRPTTWPPSPIAAAPARTSKFSTLPAPPATPTRRRPGRRPVPPTRPASTSWSPAAGSPSAPLSNSVKAEPTSRAGREARRRGIPEVLRGRQRSGRPGSSAERDAISRAVH